ncbi:MAG: class I SAM-dependent methyltransferase [Archangium sp.]|nr:class I SAM-dependent methyltransferase [Archangium sp.]
MSAEGPQTGLIRCAACGPYPLLGGVPILLADPFTYCAQFRDSILATLAEHDLADRTAVAVIDAFSRGRGTSEVFADDWTEHEATSSAPPTFAHASLKKLAAEAKKNGPGPWLEKKLAQRGTVLEVGCGAGERSEALAASVDRLLIGDRSLRAVLQATRRVRLALEDDAQVEGVVLDAEQLPIRKRALDCIIAENVVDLLDAPEDFFAGAHAALKKGGSLLLTTPEPSLGSEDDSAVEHLARQAKFKVVQKSDGLPWVRINSSRFVEVYLVQALALRA